MACIDKTALREAVVSSFWSRFNDNYPTAYRAEYKRRLKAAFDGRTFVVNAYDEYWSGAKDSDGRWTGERYAVTASGSVSLSCDGTNIKATFNVHFSDNFLVSADDHYGHN